MCSVYAPDINVPGILIDNTVTSGNIVTQNSVQPDISESSLNLMSHKLPLHVSLGRAQGHESFNYRVKLQMEPSESSLLSNITSSGLPNPKSHVSIYSQSDG